MSDHDLAAPCDDHRKDAGSGEHSGDSPTPAILHAASLRAIYDLADPEASLFIHPTGQSGNPLSRHYRDLTPLWARGDYIPMTMDRARLQGAQRLVLKPR